MPRKNTQTLDPLESFAKLWQNQPGLPPIDTELEEDFCDGVGKYTVLWQIGCGEFGIVHACSSGVSHRDDAGSASSHEELAMKSINKTELTENRGLRRAIRAINRTGLEVEALRDLSPHENINGLVEALHTPDFVHLVLERADSDLYDWYECYNQGPLPEAEARHVTIQLARALEHCHANGFVHRDLKPENVLIANAAQRLGCRVMLCDFGLCARLPGHNGGAGRKDEAHVAGLTDFAGSPGFYAPELLLDGSYDGCAIDAWSLGCVLLEMLLGQTVFGATWLTVYGEVDMAARDATGLRRRLAVVLADELDPLLFERIGRSGFELPYLLVHALLESRPAARMSARDVARSPWFESEECRCDDVTLKPSRSSLSLSSLSLSSKSSLSSLSPGAPPDHDLFSTTKWASHRAPERDEEHGDALGDTTDEEDDTEVVLNLGGRPSVVAARPGDDAAATGDEPASPRPKLALRWHKATSAMRGAIRVVA